MLFNPAPLPEAEKICATSLLKEYLDGDVDLICVLGPTASGKTRYAVSLAREFDALLAKEGSKRRAEILSADSRQVYQGMDIGTGKDMNEYGSVPVHLVDLVPAGEKYDIYCYQRDFEKAYKDVVQRECIPIMCGGSGLYIEAATCGYSLPNVPPNPALRAELQAKPTEELIELLGTLKTLHNSTDYDTRKRLIRALEIAIYEKEHPVSRSSFLPKKTYYIGTLVDRNERRSRIDARLDARLKEGLVEEVRDLLDSGISAEDLIYYGLEYKFVTLYLTGQLSYDKMRSDLSTAIHQFAKRQMTWFRAMERKGCKIHWTRVQ